MGFRFFKRIKIIPGVSLNLSKNGFSVSTGPKGAKVTVGSSGKITGSVGIPGTGVYYRETLSSVTNHSNSKSRNYGNDSGVLIINGETKSIAPNATPTNMRLAKTFGISCICSAIILLCLKIVHTQGHNLPLFLIIITTILGIIPFLAYRKFICDECGVIDYPGITKDKIKFCRHCQEAKNAQEIAQKAESEREVAILKADGLKKLLGLSGYFAKDDDSIESIDSNIREMQSQYINNYLQDDTRITQDCFRILGETKNLGTFFSRAELCIKHVTRLEEAKRLMPWINVSIGGNHFGLLNTVSNSIKNEKPELLKRCWQKELDDASKLKTEGGRKRRLQPFLWELQKYENEFNGIYEYQSVISEINDELGITEITKTAMVETNKDEFEAGKRDAFFKDAAYLIVSIGQASTSLLQSKFKISFTRATHIMDQLELAGIVGTIVEGKPREVLMKTENLDSIFCHHC